MNSLEMSVSEKPFFYIIRTVRERVARSIEFRRFFTEHTNNQILSPATHSVFSLSESVRMESKKLVNRYDKR